MDLAERPRRILRILQLPPIDVIEVEDQRFVLSQFKGLLILLHPSRAHVQLGVKKEVFTACQEKLMAHGFSGDEVISQNVKNKAEIYKAAGLVWANITKDIDPATLIPNPDEDEEIDQLAQLYLEGPASNLVGGCYWRADLLGYIFATSAGGKINGYHGSYEEILFRELSIVSSLRVAIPPSLIYNKENAGVQSFYEAQVQSSRLAADYMEVVRSPYPARERFEVCISELLAQPRVVKPPRQHKKDKEQESKPPCKKEEQVPVMSSPTIMSRGQFIMNRLAFPQLGTRVHRETGTFTLSLFCGTAVMIHPNGLYIKFFVKPDVYGVNIVQLRAAGLDESPWMLAQLSKPNMTAAARSWWNNNLTQLQREKVINYLMNLPSDSGEPYVKFGGGKGSEWRTGIYWRADLLPYILWSCTGDHIPLYRESAVEFFMNEQRLLEPLRTILQAQAQPTAHELSTRKEIARERSQQEDRVVVLAAQVAAVQAAQAAQPVIASTTEPVSAANTVKELNRKKQLDEFRERYITRTSPNPPLPNVRMSKDFPKEIICEAWVAAEECASRTYKTEVIDRDLIIAVLRDRLEASEREVRGLLAQRVGEVERQAILAVPYNAGLAGEDEAEMYINQAAGDIFGMLTRTAGQRAHSGDFIHESLVYGFMIHEVKNGRGVIGAEEGLDKLLSDVRDCEAERQLPCFAAILYSFQSEIAGHRSVPFDTFIAPNGHTLVICVNDIKDQVTRSEGHVSELDIFVDVISRVKLYVQNRLRIFFNVASITSNPYDAVILLDKILGIPGPNEKIFESLRFSEGNVNRFVEIVMQPTVPAQAVRGRPVKRTRSRRASSAGSRAGSVRKIRFPDSPDPVVPEVVVDKTIITDEAEEKAEEPQTSEELAPSVSDAPTATSSVVPRVDVPEEWRPILNTTKRWEKARKEIVKVMMNLCVPNPSGKIVRQELSTKIKAVIPNLSDSTLRAALTGILDSKYNRKQVLDGLSWRE